MEVLTPEIDSQEYITAQNTTNELIDGMTVVFEKKVSTVPVRLDYKTIGIKKKTL